MTTEYINNKSFEAAIIKFQEYKKLKAQIDMIKEEAESTFRRKAIRNVNTDEDAVRIQDIFRSHVEITEEFNKTRQNLYNNFYLLTKNIFSYKKFNFIDEDDAVQEGVLVCFDKVDRFNKERGKGFNYFTTCILNQFRHLFRMARSHNEFKKKYLEFMQKKYEIN